MTKRKKSSFFNNKESRVLIETLNESAQNNINGLDEVHNNQNQNQNQSSEGDISLFADKKSRSFSASSSNSHNKLLRCEDKANDNQRRGDETKSPETTAVDEWKCCHVFSWLQSNGFAKYAQLIAYTHEVDGATLLMLGEADFRQKPLEIGSLGDVKRLGQALASLRLRSNSRFGSRTSSIADDSDLRSILAPNLNYINIQNGLLNRDSRPNRHRSKYKSDAEHPSLLKSRSYDGLVVKQKGEAQEFVFPTREELIAKVESPDTKSKSLCKLVIAFFYCMLSLLVTSFVMVLVHDRTPDMTRYPPLPDIVLDNVPLIPWAFEVCEMIAVCMVVIWLLVLFFHKHRVIVLRRMFSLVGTVFLLRCVTMLITSLSVPGVHLDCEAKRHATIWEQFKEAYSIWKNFGLSIKGVRSCGDYMFSGHTTAITMLNHFITEYTPDSWHWLQTSSWVMNLFGIFFILAGHEHYSIDVLVAFYISSRLFLYYHVYAYNHPIVTQTDGRTRMWFPLGWFFEAGGHGRVPNEYAFPLCLPSYESVRKRLIKLVKWLVSKYSDMRFSPAKSAVNKRKCFNTVANSSKKQR